MYESNLGFSPISGWVFGKGGLFYKLPKMKGRGFIEKENDEYIYRSDPNRQIDLTGQPNEIGWNDIPDDKIKGLREDIRLKGEIDTVDYPLISKAFEERKIRRKQFKIAGEYGIDINQVVPFDSVNEIDEELKKINTDDPFNLNSDELNKIVILLDYRKILLLKENRLEELKKTEGEFKENLGLYEDVKKDENDDDLQERIYIQKRIFELAQANGVAYGEAFEFFLEAITDTINDFFGLNKNNIFVNNNKNPKVPDELKKKVVYDFGSPTMDIEAKNYNVRGWITVSYNDLNNVYTKSIKDYDKFKNEYDEVKKEYDSAILQEEKKIYKDDMDSLMNDIRDSQKKMQQSGIDIQETKFGGGYQSFRPKFKKMQNGNFRLHNVYMEDGTKINDTDDRELIIITNTKDGLFYYNLLEDKDIPYKVIDKKNNLYEINLEELKKKYKHSKKYVEAFNKKQTFFTIPINKWKRLLIPKNNRI
jgi:hypothetical protein